MRSFAFEKPFRHWCLRDCVPYAMIRLARSGVPAADHPAWVRYANELEEGKWAMDDWERLPRAWKILLGELVSQRVTSEVGTLIGVPLVRHETVSRGGGLHLMLPGSRLAPHIDYSAHPSGLERRANLILYLDDLRPGQGGGLQLCDSSGRVNKTLYPQVGEAVLWECGDETFHGVERVGDSSRVTAAAYYLARPRPNCTRRRALFLPPR